MVLDWILYFIIYNFVIGHELITINSSFINSSFTMTPHIASLCIVFPITLLTGFWLNKYITFTQSDLKTAKQFIRYCLIVALNLAINYLGLKLCVDIWGWYPTPSKMLITVITVIISFFCQKYFTFAHVSQAQQPSKPQCNSLQSDMILKDIEHYLNDGKEVVFTPRGVSMRPFIEGGVDSVILVKKPTIAIGDIVLAHIGDRYILHRVYKLSTLNYQLTLQGDGNLQGYEHCSAEDILGTVIEIRSPKGHKKPLTKGRLWRILKPLRRYLLKIYRHVCL